MEAKYRRRRLLVGATAIATVGTVVVGGIALRTLESNLSSSPIRADGDAEVLNDNTHGTNILVLGSDTRDLDDNTYGDAGGARSDAMVLAHVSKDSSRIDAVQIPRDTVMDLPACGDTGFGAYAGGFGAVNSALNHGPGCSVTAIEELSGLRIDHFIEMNFEGFATMVDAMDGLPVCLPEAMKDRKAQLDLPVGEQTVDGEEALSLARTRYAVGDGSDIARMGHQQRVMSAIIQRAKSTEVLARPDRLYGFLDAVTSSLTVDPDLDSIPALASLAQTAVGVDDDQITFMVMPWQAAPEDPNRVVPADEAAEVFSRIRIDAPMDGSDPTGSADEDAAEESTEDTAAEAAETDADEAPGDSPVTVINGSTIDGKAAQVQQRAEDWGFTVADTSTAASARQTTEIGHDGSARAEATAQQLADRLDADAVVHEDVRSGVTLMLGLDIEDVLPAEDTAAEVPGTDAGEADDPAHDSGSTSGATVGTAGTTVDSVDLCA